jgi:hypothetical protein
VLFSSNHIPQEIYGRFTVFGNCTALFGFLGNFLGADKSFKEKMDIE